MFISKLTISLPTSLLDGKCKMIFLCLLVLSLPTVKSFHLKGIVASVRHVFHTLFSLNTIRIVNWLSEVKKLVCLEGYRYTFQWQQGFFNSWRPCWRAETMKQFCMKIDLISQERKNVLFLPSNMAAMTSRENALYSSWLPPSSILTFHTFTDSHYTSIQASPSNPHHSIFWVTKYSE